MPSYRYFDIKDELHQKCIIAGDNYDGHVYHQDSKERSNAQWKFVDVGNGYYHLIDRRHGKALVAGDTYDGKVYHQDPNGRPNAAWTLRPTGTPDAYAIVDRKHDKALVAGDTYDGKVYHQDPNGRPNAAWGLTLKARGDIGPAVEVREERIVTTAETWLERVGDDRPIFDVNLPGTHDSAAINTARTTPYACQDKTIADQLRLGIRFLDVRLRIDKKGNRFEISTCHGDTGSSLGINTYQSFASLYKECNDFLDSHRTEFIVLMLRVDDWTSVTGQADRTAALNALEQELRGGPSGGYVTTAEKLRLSQVRGKIYLLNGINDDMRFGPGIGWSDPHGGVLVPTSGVRDGQPFTLQRKFELYVQDKYNDVSEEDKLRLFIAAIGQKRPGRLVINFASAVKPASVLSIKIGPDLYGVYINRDILQWFADQPAGSRPEQLGWSLFDFAQRDYKIEGFPFRNCIDLYVASNFGYALPY